MLFNSYVFIFVFLPVVLSVYAFVRKHPERTWAIAWLTLASLFYYAWWKPQFLILLLVSISVNAVLGKLLCEGRLSRSALRGGRRGNWVNQPNHNPTALFDAYIPAIMRAHTSLPKIELQPTAFQALDRMVEICRKSGVEVYFLITPNHPYDDYRILSLGYWDILDQWHRKIATYPHVLGSSQYTAPLIEPISEGMLYWNDPLHPSLKFGNLVLRALQGERSPEIPADILLPVDEHSVESVLRKRRDGLERWIAHNRRFTEAFDQAKVATGNDPSQRR